MKLYITVWDGDNPAVHDYRFTGTQADQRKFEKELKAKGIQPERSDAVEVPIDKSRLIEWLNTFKTLEE